MFYLPIKPHNFTLVFFVVNFFFLSVNAQESTDLAKITWGDVERVGIGSSLIEADDEGIYLLHGSSVRRGWDSTFELEYIDSSLKQSKSSKVNFKALSLNRVMHDVIMFNNELLMLGSDVNKDGIRVKFIVQQIGKTSLSLEESYQELPIFDSKRDIGDFHLRWMTSKNKEVLVFEYYDLNENDEKEETNYVAFDKNLNLLWREKIDLRIQNGGLITTHELVDNEGNLFLSGPLHSFAAANEVDEKIIIQRLKYGLFTVTDQGKRLKKYTIAYKSRFITGLIFKKNLAGNLIGGGFYGYEIDEGSTGAFSFLLDLKTETIKLSKTTDFDRAFILDGYTKLGLAIAKNKESLGKRVSFANARLKDIILKQDGGLILISEQSYSFSTSSTRVNQYGMELVTSTTTFYSGELVMVSFNLSGEVEWNHKMIKYNASSGSQVNLFSYVLVEDEDKMHLLFNDNIKNHLPKTKGGLNRPYKHKFRAPGILTIDFEGNASRKLLFPHDKKQRKTIVPKLCKLTSDKSLLLYANIDGTRRYGRLDFK